MMSESDIEFQLQFEEIDASIMAGFEKIENRLNRRPVWWQVSIGSKEATPEEYEKARLTYKQFLKFSRVGSGHYSGRSFQELMDLFMSAKLQNRIPQDESSTMQHKNEMDGLG